MPTIYGMLTVDAIGPGFTEDPGDPKSGKPYLRVTFPDGLVIHITANVAELLGGVGAGTKRRWEDLQHEQGQSGSGR